MISLYPIKRSLPLKMKTSPIFALKKCSFCFDSVKGCTPESPCECTALIVFMRAFDKCEKQAVDAAILLKTGNFGVKKNGNSRPVRNYYPAYLHLPLPPSPTVFVPLSFCAGQNRCVKRVFSPLCASAASWKLFWELEKRGQGTLLLGSVGLFHEVAQKK